MKIVLLVEQIKKGGHLATPVMVLEISILAD